MQESFIQVVVNGYKTIDLKLPCPVLTHVYFSESYALWPRLPLISSLGQCYGEEDLITLNKQFQKKESRQTNLI